MHLRLGGPVKWWVRMLVPLWGFYYVLCVCYSSIVYVYCFLNLFLILFSKRFFCTMFFLVVDTLKSTMLLLTLFGWTVLLTTAELGVLCSVGNDSDFHRPCSIIIQSSTPARCSYIAKLDWMDWIPALSGENPIFSLPNIWYVNLIWYIIADGAVTLFGLFLS